MSRFTKRAWYGFVMSWLTMSWVTMSTFGCGSADNRVVQPTDELSFEDMKAMSLAETDVEPEQ